MRKHLALLVALFFIGLGCSAPRVADTQNRKPESRATPAPADAEGSARAAEAVKGLRDRVLKAPPEELGFEKDAARLKVWAVLLEVAFPAGVATLVSFQDGTASLYTSTGGGVLGGYSARGEARRFVAEAGKHLPRMKPAEAFPYPGVGRIKFYVRTPDGVRTAEAAEGELTGGGHTLSPLFLAGNEVLTGLRKASEQARPGGAP